MAHLVVLYNPLDTSRRRLVDLPDGTPLLGWLDVNEPGKFEHCTREVWLNGGRFEDPEYVTKPGDEVLVTFRPGDPVVIGPLIVQALIGAAIGMFLGLIFRPSRPKAGNTPSPSQVYGIGAPRNAARLGEPIPVIYGSVIALPDYAAQPYTEYVNNEQLMHALLCLGQGEHEVHEMLIGDSSASSLDAGIASWQVFGPADHASAFGTIAAATGVRENVVTSADVADQELIAPNAASNTIPSTWYWRWLSRATGTTPPSIPPVFDLSSAYTLEARLALLPPTPALGTVVQGYLGGAVIHPEIGDFIHYVDTWQAAAYDPAASTPAGSLVPPPGYGTIGATKWVGGFETCKAGQRGTSLELDFVFGGGLYVMDSSGDLGTRAVTLLIRRQQIDDTGASAGPMVTTDVTFTASSNTAQRYTYKMYLPLGRYRVSVARQTDGDGRAGTSDRVQWTGLKFDLAAASPPGPVYGNVTLVAVKLRASNAVAGDAAASIRFRVSRKLPPPEGGALAPTVNPADAFADIVVAAYGGNRPRNADELDLDALAAARARWTGHNGFNAVFDQPSTVWEALSLSVQTVSAAPLPVGSRMTIVQDGVQPVRAQMFTDANIATGSLQITHAFDRDGTPQGMRVEYRDPRTFSAAALLDPVDAPDYDTLSLFGCTSEAVAAEHARLAQNRRSLQRTTLAFTTELEGLSCLPGDRIGVQARMPRWAQSARVQAVAGLTLTLDAALQWTAAATHALQMRDPQGRPHVVHGVVRGNSDFKVIVPALPFEPVTRADGMEPTIVAFGVEGQEITDWSVTTMQPHGDAVTIQAVNYTPAVWAGAAAHLLLPLPFEEATR